MRGEPHSSTAPRRYAASNRGEQYSHNCPQRTAVVANNVSAPVENNSRGAHRRLTFNNFGTFNAREKKIPLDANTQAAPNTKFWQLPERASFYCNKCRRDNIISDSIAVDTVHQVMLCTRCFTRIIRPRFYRPNRVVPFPSLLSWLNYKPSKVMEMSEDIASRPAEAVAPSGERIAVPTLAGGDRAVHIQNLPAIAMNIVPSVRSGTSRVGSGLPTAGHQEKQQQQSEDSHHPCCRVWGSCLHGETCLFRRAPYDLCICFLMGLCSGDQDKCKLLHQYVFDLPNTAEPMPTSRHVKDFDNPQSEWGKWMDKKRNSPNSAEWQLWHNGPVDGLLDAYAPVTQEAEEEIQSNGKPEIKLNFSDISAALRGLRE